MDAIQAMKTFDSKKTIIVPKEPSVLTSEKEVLLKALIAKFATSAPSKLFKIPEKTINEIIFESDVDGIHYYLIRSTPPSKEKINLSPREQAIAKLVAQGLPNKSIGISLHISHWTVATHLRRIFVKLGVTSRTAMIARVLEENLLHQ